MGVHSWLAASRHFGVDAPPFIWWASGLLIAATVWLCLLLWRAVRRERGPLRRVVRSLAEIRGPRPVGGSGLPASRYERVRQAYSDAGLEAEWDELAAALVRRRSENGGDEYWLPEASSAILSPRSEGFNRAFYSALPGLITSFGLFLTFLAILLALKDVTVSGGMVLHVDELINGLSGKFVSSVVALLLAIGFTLVERRLAHDLEQERSRLAGAIDALFPHLSAVRVLSDLQQGAGDQIRSFLRDFGADLAVRMQQGFSESLGPTIARMVQAIEDMNQHLRAAQAREQDTMVEALAHMAERFNASLSGQTGKQFEDLGRQIQSSVEALRLVSEGGRNSIEAAIASLGRAAQELTASASSASRTASEAAAGSAARATEAADSVLQRASAWSQESAQRLQALLESESRRAGEVEKMRASLATTADQLLGLVDGLTQLSAGAKETMAEAARCGSELSAAATSAREVQSALFRLGEEAQGWIRAVRDSGELQGKLWRNVQESMVSYRQLFAEVESSGAGMLQRLREETQKQFEVARAGYDKLLDSFDSHFGSAVHRLGGTVEELGENLDALSDAVARVSGGT